MGSREQILEGLVDDGSVMDKARAFYPSVGFRQTTVAGVSKYLYFEVYTFEKVLDAPLNAKTVETSTIHNTDDRKEA
ncbi:hypothetical protein F441_20131 [Phytophthora nicotianae CJ01A1]|uniref:N-acetyltransferase domain-containing protein n=3 Tax=Phytophthora nicotianae TaxID=4792 RepID=W2Y8K3_PHYNI|nr:hypothetical protein L915_19686 [Phytophthora nicotianae]ETL26818.1 hypothetical protein L916_19571 [Phytophthora nicotianae]ETM33296.1 hypothetical protein L914_19457 [Phytophthora nicotianae]ETP02856.1 hypothetical protein F441_20131 [Phytophthora nicotianae CJ01A1]ETP31042.1 hypothetical protein F442_20063 [Phytophthora nicotianae P10297]